MLALHALLYSSHFALNTNCAENINIFYFIGNCVSYKVKKDLQNGNLCVMIIWLLKSDAEMHIERTI